jgi:large subunit ribosomal protein L32
MAVPKRKTSTSKRNMRRSHHSLSPINIVTDSTTGEYTLPHHISLTDGYYKGKQVIAPKNTSSEEDQEGK